MPTLPADAREIFEREGWYVAPALVGAAQVASLLGATQRLEHEAADFDRNRLLRGVSFELQTATNRRDEPGTSKSASSATAVSRSPSLRQRDEEHRVIERRRP